MKKNKYIDKNQSNVLKTVAIILIIICHLKFPLFNLSDHVFTFVGRFGVALFLFITGYGFNKIYIEKNKPFLPRILKIYVVYFVLMTFYYLTNVFYFEKSIGILTYVIHLFWLQTFFNANAVIYPPIHFFSILLVVYLLTYTSKFFKNKYKFIVLGIFIFNIITIYFSKFNNNLFRFLIPLNAFLLGITVSKKEWNKTNITIMVVNLLIVIYMFRFFFQFFIMVLLIIVLLKTTTKIKKLNVFNYFGKRSYSLFITHYFFLPIFNVGGNFSLKSYTAYFFLSFLWFYFISHNVIPKYLLKISNIRHSYIPPI